MTDKQASGEFRFAIITDTHIRAPQGDLSSPFPVNEKANDRARFACELIAAHEPEFTIHLGDMVHPLPHMAAYDEAVVEAKSIFTPLLPKLHFVPGNHDIGDKPSPGMPAKPATLDSVARYTSAFGEDWSSFEHKNTAFVIINSSLVNSGSERENQQRQWLEKTLESFQGQRIFLFSHYPPFITDPAETDHYDNYAEPGRSWLLGLASQYGIEAIFSGHVHHYFFNRFESVHLHCLPATSFTRQDYAEMFAVGPAEEYGRDDKGKFSVCIVEVNQSSYETKLIPTRGQSLSTGETFRKPELKQGRTGLVPHLRHSWFESRHLPYNGPMEEFSRKRVRNDYPLLRLHQLGIDTVRVPLSDRFDPAISSRIDDWAATGIKFVYFHIGVPDASILTSLRSHSEAAALEILSAVDDIADIAPALDTVLSAIKLPVFVSRITTSADVLDSSAVFAHSVSSGFRSEVIETTIGALDSLPLSRPPGLVFQIPWGQDPVDTIMILADHLAASEYKLAVNLRLADSNPARSNFADKKIASVLRNALRVAREHNHVMVQCDTFEDVDRGYHPRNGLIDRLGNIRLDCR